MNSDFRSMKRSELQALCKKHGIPANITNAQMAERLASLLLQEEEKSKPKGCLKVSGSRTSEESRKVSFSLPDEGARAHNSGGKRRRSSRRLSVGGETPVPEVPVKTSRPLAAPGLWSPVIERKTRKGTEGVRRNAEVGLEPELSGVVGDDAGKMEVESTVLVPVTRSLRNKVVVGVGGDGLNAGLETRKGYKRGRRSGLGKDGGGEDEKDAVKKSSVVGVQTTRSLRNRVVVVEGEGKLMEDVEVQRPQKKRRTAKGEEDTEAPFTWKPGGEYEESLTVIPAEAAPARRSRRNLSRSDTSVQEGKGGMTDEAGGENIERDPGARISSNILALASAAAAAARNLVGEDIPVGRKKSRKQVASHALVPGDLECVKSYSTGLIGTVPAEAQKGKLPGTDKLARRSTRSSKRDIPEEYNRSHSNDVLAVDEEVLKKNKKDRQGTRLQSVKEDAKPSSSIVGGASNVTECQEEKIQEVVEPVRRSTRSLRNMINNDKRLPERGDSYGIDDAIKKKKSTKQTTNLQLQEEVPEISSNILAPASRAAAGNLVGEDILVGSKKSRKQVASHALVPGDLECVKSYSTGLIGMVPAEAQKGKLPGTDKLARRSTRSTRRDIPEENKRSHSNDVLAVDEEVLKKNKKDRQGTRLQSVKEDAKPSSSIVGAASNVTECQEEKIQEVVEPVRRSTRSLRNMINNDKRLPERGDSYGIHDAIKKNKSTKQTAKLQLQEEIPEIPLSKTGAVTTAAAHNGKKHPMRPGHSSRRDDKASGGSKAMDICREGGFKRQGVEAASETQGRSGLQKRKVVGLQSTEGQSHLVGEGLTVTSGSYEVVNTANLCILSSHAPLFPSDLLVEIETVVAEHVDSDDFGEKNFSETEQSTLIKEPLTDSGCGGDIMPLDRSHQVDLVVGLSSKFNEELLDKFPVADKAGELSPLSSAEVSVKEYKGEAVKELDTPILLNQNCRIREEILAASLTAGASTKTSGSALSQVRSVPPETFPSSKEHETEHGDSDDFGEKNFSEMEQSTLIKEPLTDSGCGRDIMPLDSSHQVDLVVGLSSKSKEELPDNFPVADKAGELSPLSSEVSVKEYKGEAGKELDTPILLNRNCRISEEILAASLTAGASTKTSGSALSQVRSVRPETFPSSKEQETVKDVKIPASESITNTEDSSDLRKGLVDVGGTCLVTKPAVFVAELATGTSSVGSVIKTDDTNGKEKIFIEVIQPPFLENFSLDFPRGKENEHTEEVSSKSILSSCDLLKGLFDGVGTCLVTEPAVFAAELASGTSAVGSGVKTESTNGKEKVFTEIESPGSHNFTFDIPKGKEKEHIEEESSKSILSGDLDASISEPCGNQKYCNVEMPIDAGEPSSSKFNRAPEETEHGDANKLGETCADLIDHFSEEGNDAYPMLFAGNTLEELVKVQEEENEARNRECYAPTLAISEFENRIDTISEDNSRKNNFCDVPRSLTSNEDFLLDSNIEENTTKYSESPNSTSSSNVRHFVVGNISSVPTISVGCHGMPDDNAEGHILNQTSNSKNVMGIPTEGLDLGDALPNIKFTDICEGEVEANDNGGSEVENENLYVKDALHGSEDGSLDKSFISNSVCLSGGTIHLVDKTSNACVPRDESNLFGKLESVISSVELPVESSTEKTIVNSGKILKTQLENSDDQQLAIDSRGFSLVLGTSCHDTKAGGLTLDQQSNSKDAVANSSFLCAGFSSPQSISASCFIEKDKSTRGCHQLSEDYLHELTCQDHITSSHGRKSVDGAVGSQVLPKSAYTALLSVHTGLESGKELGDVASDDMENASVSEPDIEYKYEAKQVEKENSDLKNVLDAVKDVDLDANSISNISSDTVGKVLDTAKLTNVIEFQQNNNLCHSSHSSKCKPSVEEFPVESSILKTPQNSHRRLAPPETSCIKQVVVSNELPPSLENSFLGSKANRLPLGQQSDSKDVMENILLHSLYSQSKLESCQSAGNRKGGFSPHELDEIHVHGPMDHNHTLSSGGGIDVNSAGFTGSQVLPVAVHGGVFVVNTVHEREYELGDKVVKDMEDGDSCKIVVSNDYQGRSLEGKKDSNLNITHGSGMTHRVAHECQETSGFVMTGNGHGTSADGNNDFNDANLMGFEGVHPEISSNSPLQAIIEFESEGKLGIEVADCLKNTDVSEGEISNSYEVEGLNVECGGIQSTNLDSEVPFERNYEVVGESCNAAITATIDEGLSTEQMSDLKSVVRISRFLSTDIYSSQSSIESRKTEHISKGTTSVLDPQLCCSEACKSFYGETDSQLNEDYTHQLGGSHAGFLYSEVHQRTPNQSLDVSFELVGKHGLGDGIAGDMVNTDVPKGVPDNDLKEAFYKDNMSSSGGTDINIVEFQCSENFPGTPNHSFAANTELVEKHRSGDGVTNDLENIDVFERASHSEYKETTGKNGDSDVKSGPAGMTETNADTLSFLNRGHDSCAVAHYAVTTGSQPNQDKILSPIGACFSGKLENDKQDQDRRGTSTYDFSKPLLDSTISISNSNQKQFLLTKTLNGGEPFHRNFIAGDVEHLKLSSSLEKEDSIATPVNQICEQKDDSHPSAAFSTSSLERAVREASFLVAVAKAMTSELQENTGAASYGCCNENSSLCDVSSERTLPNSNAKPATLPESPCIADIAIESNDTPICLTNCLDVDSEGLLSNKQRTFCNVQVKSDTEVFSNESSFNLNMFEECSTCNDAECSSLDYSYLVGSVALPETDNGFNAFERACRLEDDVLDVSANEATISLFNGFNNIELVAEEEKVIDCSLSYQAEFNMFTFNQSDQVDPPLMSDLLEISSSISTVAGIHAEKSNEHEQSNGLEQMEDINNSLTDFTISSAKKIEKSVFQHTPLKSIGHVNSHLAINELKDKENTPTIKVDHYSRPTVERSSALGSVKRRPLQAVPNNSKVLQ